MFGFDDVVKMVENGYVVEFDMFLDEARTVEDFERMVDKIYDDEEYTYIDDITVDDETKRVFVTTGNDE